jgi:predicted nucleotidyltransferase
MNTERNSEAPPALLDAFDRAVDALGAKSTAYALIGGFAVAHHGIPRPTRDVDFLLAEPRTALPELFERLHAQGFTFSLESVLEELRRDHLTKIHYRDVRVDFLDAVIPLFRRTVAGAQVAKVRGRDVNVASAEDLIALKLVAARDDDLRDVRGILLAQRDHLDLDAVRRSLGESCGEDRLAMFEKLVTERRQAP